MVFRIYMEEDRYKHVVERSNRLGVHPKKLIFKCIELFLTQEAMSFEKVVHSDLRPKPVVLGLTPQEFNWFKIEAKYLKISRTCLVFSAFKTCRKEAERQLKLELK